MEQVKILIVENELLISQEISSRLGKAGYMITGEVQTAADALLAVKEQTPDLVIMDIHLDGPVDGIEAAAAIQKEYPVQVIFLTDLDNKHVHDRASKIKGTFLVKPFNERQVIASIQQAIHAASHNIATKPGDPELPAEGGYMLNDCLFVRVDSNHYKKMFLKDIAFLEADGAYANIYTVQNERHTYSISMNHLHDRIGHPSFVRVSRSFVVNLDLVEEIKGNMLVIRKREITIGEKYRELINKLLPMLR
jgi:DNA-binding LytR/AlgR family response regulator